MNKVIEKIFQSKQRRRRALAKLPVSEKVKILVSLQKIASPLLAARGIHKIPWRI